MRVLLLVAHPDTTEHGFIHKAMKVAKEALESKGHETRVVDLYKINYIKPVTKDDYLEERGNGRISITDSLVDGNTVAEIEEQQANIMWSTHIIVFAPMFYFRLPAGFYGWCERTLMTQKDIRGKKFMVVINPGAGKDYYNPQSTCGTIEFLLSHITCGMCPYVGWTPLRTQVFYDTMSKSAEEQERMLGEWRKRMESFESIPELPISGSPCPAPEMVAKIEETYFE